MWGYIGFLGVIDTINANAKLAREQHEREVEHSRKAIRTALTVELNSIKRIYEDRVRSFRDPANESQSGMVPIGPYDSIYRQNLDKLGLLPEKQMRVVVEVYALVAELPRRLTLLSFRGQGSREAPDGYVPVSYDNARYAAQIHETFIAEIDKALSCLNANSADVT